MIPLITFSKPEKILLDDFFLGGGGQIINVATFCKLQLNGMLFRMQILFQFDTIY